MSLSRHDRLILVVQTLVAGRGADLDASAAAVDLAARVPPHAVPDGVVGAAGDLVEWVVGDGERPRWIPDDLSPDFGG